MANKKVDPAVKQVGVCGCVMERVKKLLIEEAVMKGVSVANVIGGILERWAAGKVMKGGGEYLPYRHHQEEKIKREGKEYREGPLGLILKKRDKKKEKVK